MNQVYAIMILAVLSEDPQVKRLSVRKLVIRKLDLDKDNLPTNVPTEHQVRNKSD